MGKVHGSLARAGKVRAQTPKPCTMDKEKEPVGRAKKRMLYNDRFVTKYFYSLRCLISLALMANEISKLLLNKSCIYKLDTV